MSHHDSPYAPTEKRLNFEKANDAFRVPPAQMQDLIAQADREVAIEKAVEAEMQAAPDADLQDAVNVIRARLAGIGMEVSGIIITGHVGNVHTTLDIDFHAL